VQVIYLFIMKRILKVVINKKRLEIHWSTLNTYCARRKATVLFASHSSISGVRGNGHSNRCIITFPYYRSTFKKHALLS